MTSPGKKLKLAAIITQRFCMFQLVVESIGLFHLVYSELFANGNGFCFNHGCAEHLRETVEIGM